MKSIRWIQNVLIDGKPASIEIMIGVNNIADRCYVRVNQEPEHWFVPQSDQRDLVIAQGRSLLQKLLQARTVTLPDGSAFSW